MWIFHCVKAPEEQQIVSYWRSRLILNVMNEDFTFNSAAVPSDLRRYMKIVEDGKKEKKTFYLPLLLVDELRSRLNDLIMNSTTKAVPLTISYDTITLRKFRIWIHIQAVIYSLKHFGFSEQNLDEIKAMFVESGLHVLALSVLVPAFHLSFEIFAFKNDIRFWQEKKSLLWKVKKVLALSPKFHVIGSNCSFTWTFSLLAQAMKFLSYLMYPLCIKVKIKVHLLFKHQGVYAFGFLSMVPQLFINYKVLESQCWFAFASQGLNTFISDVFSGIITTPGPHHLACFRDDVVFLIYLYQRRWGKHTIGACGVDKTFLYLIVL
uniref:Lipid scramblase CLPTM1L n=1 Tax=Sinocyclocheilus anshuiensis TaxID=1608454 RepID=A0A671SEN4_9TELE